MSQTTKITVKIYEPLLTAFGKEIDSLFIKRDAFLNSMIQEEVQHLTRDLEGKKLSVRAKRYIAGELKKLGTVQVNIVMDKTTADQLNAIVEKTNIVRDAFINRLIMLLRSNSNLLKYLDLPVSITGSAFESYVEPMPTSPLTAIAAVHHDPLFYLRVAAEERHGTGLYLIDLSPKFVGFACYLDDSQVPGTKDFEQAQLDAQALLDELVSVEAEAFQKPKQATGGIS